MQFLPAFLQHNACLCVAISHLALRQVSTTNWLPHHSTYCKTSASHSPFVLQPSRSDVCSHSFLPEASPRYVQVRCFKYCSCDGHASYDSTLSRQHQSFRCITSTLRQVLLKQLQGRMHMNISANSFGLAKIKTSVAQYDVHCRLSR